MEWHRGTVDSVVDNRQGFETQAVTSVTTSRVPAFLALDAAPSADTAATAEEHTAQNSSHFAQFAPASPASSTLSSSANCVFEDQAGFGPAVLGTSKMQGLAYVVQSDEYPDHLVQVQVEKLRARLKEDEEFGHGLEETRRILHDRYS